jgi:hypothetical protein
VPADPLYLDQLAERLARDASLSFSLAQRRVKALPISAQPPLKGGFADRGE